MTDAVGGVDVNVEEARAGRRLQVFTKGVQHMDGETALAFVRERKQLSEGDISPWPAPARLHQGAHAQDA